MSQTETVTVIEEWTGNSMIRYVPHENGTRTVLEHANLERPFVKATITDYSAFDLDGPAHKANNNRIRDALADGLLKAMGLPALGSSQTEQKIPHEQNTPREKTRE